MTKNRKKEQDLQDIHPEFQKGKRLTPEALLGHMESGDVTPVFVENQHAQEKAGFMKASGRADAEAREASARATVDLTTDWLSGYLNVGEKVRKGGKIGGNNRWAEAPQKDRELVEWYLAEKVKLLPGGGHRSDSFVLKLKGAPLNQSKLTRLKRVFRKEIEAQLRANRK